MFGTKKGHHQKTSISKVKHGGGIIMLYGRLKQIWDFFSRWNHEIVTNIGHFWLTIHLVTARLLFFHTHTKRTIHCTLTLFLVALFALSSVALLLHLIVKCYDECMLYCLCTWVNKELNVC